MAYVFNPGKVITHPSSKVEPEKVPLFEAEEDLKKKKLTKTSESLKSINNISDLEFKLSALEVENLKLKEENERFRKFIEKIAAVSNNLLK